MITEILAERARNESRFYIHLHQGCKWLAKKSIIMFLFSIVGQQPSPW